MYNPLDYKQPHAMPAPPSARPVNSELRPFPTQQAQYPPLQLQSVQTTVEEPWVSPGSHTNFQQGPHGPFTQPQQLKHQFPPRPHQISDIQIRNLQPQVSMSELARRSQIAQITRENARHASQAQFPYGRQAQSTHPRLSSCRFVSEEEMQGFQQQHLQPVQFQFPGGCLSSGQLVPSSSLQAQSYQQQHLQPVQYLFPCGRQSRPGPWQAESSSPVQAYGYQQQAFQPGEPQQYKQPQQYGQAVGSFAQANEKPVGSSAENPISLKDDSVEGQPAVPHPTSATPPAVAQKPRAAPRKFINVTKRMVAGDWEGMSELHETFIMATRRWPRKYNCSEQSWFLHRDDPGRFYCQHINTSIVKHGWQLTEAARKEDEEKRQWRSRLDKNSRGLVAPTTSNRKKRGPTDEAESSSKPATKRAKKTAQSSAKAPTPKTSRKPKAPRGKRNCKAPTQVEAPPALAFEPEILPVPTSVVETQVESLPAIVEARVEVEAPPAPVVEPIVILGHFTCQECSKLVKIEDRYLDHEVCNYCSFGFIFKNSSNAPDATQDSTTPAPAIGTQVEASAAPVVETEIATLPAATAETIEAKASPEPSGEDDGLVALFDEVVEEDDGLDALFDEEEGEETLREQAPVDTPVENAPTKTVPVEGLSVESPTLEQENDSADDEDVFEADMTAELERQYWEEVTRMNLVANRLAEEEEEEEEDEEYEDDDVAKEVVADENVLEEGMAQEDDSYMYEYPDDESEVSVEE